jgi:hypothetical protein
MQKQSAFWKACIMEPRSILAVMHGLLIHCREMLRLFMICIVRKSFFITFCIVVQKYSVDCSSTLLVSLQIAFVWSCAIIFIDHMYRSTVLLHILIYRILLARLVYCTFSQSWFGLQYWLRSCCLAFCSQSVVDIRLENNVRYELQCAPSRCFNMSTDRSIYIYIYIYTFLYMLILMAIEQHIPYEHCSSLLTICILALFFFIY